VKINASYFVVGDGRQIAAGTDAMAADDAAARIIFHQIVRRRR
jgi:hypothetical protein